MRGGRRSIISLLAAGTAVVAAACAQPVPKAPTHPVGHPAAATAPTLAGNERLARQEAVRLVGLARLPAHPTRVRHAPHGLDGPVEESAVSSQLDRHALWTVGLPFATALAFVKAHPPVGLSGDANTFGVHGPGLLVDGFVYDTATRPWAAGGTRSH